jgi:hypothetical protein
MEYKESHPDGYNYSQYCYHFSEYLRHIFDDIGLVKTITSGIDPVSGAHIRNVSIRERL